MSTAVEEILSNLRVVAAERAQRLKEGELGSRVIALKLYQQRRFLHTYADLLQHPRYGAVSHFFLEELYSPKDFTQRDEQFARVVPGMVRLFPIDVVETVAALAQLHALSETLDSAMGSKLERLPIDKKEYVHAWQATGRHRDRELQVDLTLDVAHRLDRLTTRTLLRNSLRLMRAPARAAGLSQLQQFLESGFDIFREMKGAGEFIEIVRSREHALASALFEMKLAMMHEPSFGLASSLLPGQIVEPR